MMAFPPGKYWGGERWRTVCFYYTTVHKFVIGIKVILFLVCVVWCLVGSSQRWRWCHWCVLRRSACTSLPSGPTAWPESHRLQRWRYSCRRREPETCSLQCGWWRWFSAYQSPGPTDSWRGQVRKCVIDQGVQGKEGMKASSLIIFGSVWVECDVFGSGLFVVTMSYLVQNF